MINVKLIYIYIYKTKAFEAPTIFHLSLKKRKLEKKKLLKKKKLKPLNISP